MADAKTRIQSVREWITEHKLRTVGCLWLSGIAGSIAYNWSQPNMKTSVKIIHASQRQYMTPNPFTPEGARKQFRSSYRERLRKELNLMSGIFYLHRLHAQALTLASLAGAALVEYYDHKSGAKAEQYATIIHNKD